MTRNDQYFDDIPKLKNVILKIIPDANTAIVSLEKGEIHQASILAKDVHRYQNHSTFDIYQYYDLVYTYLGFNLKHPFFSDRRVRQAFAYAVNKEAIVKGVLKGRGLPAHIPSSPELWAYPQQSSIVTYEYNAQKATQLLTSAGFVMNSKTGILEKDGVPFKFSLITNKGNKDREKTAQILQQFLKKIGVDMSIQLLEWSAFLKIVNAQEDPKPFDAVILGWSLGLDPDGYSIWHSSQYPQGFNFIGYNNKTVDQLLEKGRSEVVREERQLIYKDIFNSIATDVPYVFLYYPESIVGVNNQVKGLSKPGPAGLMNRIEGIYLD